MKNSLYISLLALFWGIGHAVQAQQYPSVQKTGIKTKTPTRSLDVNGKARVQTIGNNTAVDTKMIIVTETNDGDNNGVLFKARPLDVVFSSGLYVTGTNQWNNIYIGPSACRLDFAGHDGSLFLTFSVLYSNGQGFMAPDATATAINKGNPGVYVVTIEAVGSTGFKVVVLKNDDPYKTYAFTIVPGTSGKGSISTTGLSGTFISNAIYQEY